MLRTRKEAAHNYRLEEVKGRMKEVRTSLQSAMRGRLEIQGTALPFAFLFLPGDTSLSASAARAPCMVQGHFSQIHRSKPTCSCMP